MSRILLCARTLIDLVLEKVNTIEELIPKPFLITKTRLKTKENRILENISDDFDIISTS